MRAGIVRAHNTVNFSGFHYQTYRHTIIVIAQKEVTTHKRALNRGCISHCVSPAVVPLQLLHLVLNFTITLSCGSATLYDNESFVF